MRDEIKVALIGQPNVGKSHLINSITGATLHIGNFAGVTVEKKEISFKRDGFDITMTDLPGLYSMNVYSPEEQVAKNFILNEDYDLIVNVVDANALQRNLSLTLQLLDLNKKMILAINMIDEIEKVGGKIDADEISKMLNIPVVLVSAKEKRGVGKLIENITLLHKSNQSSNRLDYGHRLEEAVIKISDILKKDQSLKLSPRFLAIRLFENDRDIYKSVHDKPIFLDVHDKFIQESENLTTLHDESDCESVFANSRVAITKFICQKALVKAHKDTSDEKIDKIFMNRWFGLPIFLFLMWGLFQLTFVLGEYPMGLIEELFAILSEKSTELIPQGVINDAISIGFIPAVGTVISFLPNILILFMGIDLLEQTGYMARAAYLLDGTLKKFGLHGKAFIPMITGFGCSIPAYMSAKILKNPKDKLITMLIISFFSCSARLPVYILFISAFFDPSQAGNILFGIYLSGALLALIFAKIFRLTLFRGTAEPFVMEMPKYRFPSIKGLIRELRIKTVLFIRKAGVFIGVASILIWILSSYPIDTNIQENYNQKIELAQSEDEKKALGLELNSAMLENSYIGTIGKTIEPIFEPLGFDWKMSVATITALAAKEVAVATLATLNSMEAEDEPSESLVEKIRASMDIKAAIAFIVIVMIYSPCLAAMATFVAEVKDTKWRIFYFIYPNVVAWLMAYAVYNILVSLGL